MARHVLIDHAEALAGPSAGHGALVRVARLVDPDGTAATRAVASDVEGADADLGALRELGYDTYAVDGRDEVRRVACMVVAHAVLDHDPGGSTLAIVSSDVGEDPFGASLPAQAARALAWGWSVEVWTWDGRAIGAYADLLVAHPGRVRQVGLAGTAGRDGSAGASARAEPEGRGLPPDALGAEQPWV